MKVNHCIIGFTIFLFGIDISQSDKPTGLSQGIYCEGCIATVKELLKKVDKKTGESREVRVIEGMEDICELKNFGSYEYSPPKTGQACKFLMEKYDEEIENMMVAETEADFELKICYELTEACKGVDRSKKEKEELEVNINDKKQKLQSGNPNDPEKFNVDINEEGAAEKLVNQINMAIKDKKSNNNGAGGDDEGDDDEGDDDDDDDDKDDEGDDDDNKGDDDDNKADEEDDAGDEDLSNKIQDELDKKTEL